MLLTLCTVVLALVGSEVLSLINGVLRGEFELDTRLQKEDGDLAT